RRRSRARLLRRDLPRPRRGLEAREPGGREARRRAAPADLLAHDASRGGAPLHPRRPLEHGKILETVTFAREVAHFEPDVIVIDHFDIAHAAEEGMATLRALARERNVELWLSAYAESMPQGLGQLPAPLDRFGAQLSVVVYLQPERDVVRLRLLTDHDSKDLADLQLRLDPHTMRVI